MVVLCALALLGCALGLAFPPATRPRDDLLQQGLDLARIVCTAALAVVLVLGPGVVWRARRVGGRVDLGFLALPGLALLAGTGGAAWALAGHIPPRVVCAAVLVPVLLWLCSCVVVAAPGELLGGDEEWVLVIAGCVLGIAVGRTLWSLGPVGEMWSGTIPRTLEVGDRSDSRISFAVVQLVVIGRSPFSALSNAYFTPYDFSARGPLAGLASSAVVLLSGGRPPALGLEHHQWTPFDRDGFMAYRLAMMTFACTAFISLWTITRRLGGERAARLALLLAATTPFLIHEVWFTWPKLLATSLVLLAALSVIERRPLLAGALIGAGYLVHPVALLSLPVLGLIALWPLVGGRLGRPQVGAALWVLAGAAVSFATWRLVNGPHYDQAKFLHYVTEAGRHQQLVDTLLRAYGGHPAPVTISEWLSARRVSVENTLVPMRLVLLSAHDPSVNAVTSCSPLCAGRSPGVVHFFFQYWNTLPFGMGIAFFPLLLAGLWRAAWRWPWPTVAAVVLPLVAFALYWGDATTGLLREGLHAWVLTLLIVVALEQAARGAPWLRTSATRLLLALRSVEVLLVAVVPAIATRHSLGHRRFVVTDIAALLTIVALCGVLAACLWRERSRWASGNAEAPAREGLTASLGGADRSARRGPAGA